LELRIALLNKYFTSAYGCILTILIFEEVTQRPMMKKVTAALLTLIFFLSVERVKAQYVTIPDPEFVNWMVSSGLAGCLNGNQLDTTCSALVSKKSFTSSGQLNLTDMTGIQYFDSLEYLHITYCPNLTFLPLLPERIKYIYCAHNQISSITNIPASDTSLQCGGNSLSSLPALPSGLKFLGISNNPMPNLPVLPAGLTTLEAALCQISIIGTLPSGLQSLNVSGQAILSFAPFPTTLKNLEINSCNLSLLPALPSGLESLNINNNPLVAVNSLPSGLKYLYSNYINVNISSLPINLKQWICESNNYTSLPALPASLENLGCSSNDISSLPSLPGSLTYVDASDNLLTSLPSLPVSLKTLLAENNQITSLPALPSSLEYVDLDNNNLTSLPVLPNSLKFLLVNNNQINAIPNFPLNIEYVGANQNPIDSLPPFNNKIKSINFAYTSLTTIPSPPLSLKEIYIDNSQITTLPVMNDSMYRLSIGNNPLLSCMPAFRKIYSLDFSNTAITCLPNVIQATFSNPPLTGIPVCNIFNPTSCDFTWNISGTIYNDSVNDCIYQPNESTYEGVKVNLYKDSVLVQQTFTDGVGRYTFDADTGIYIISVDTSTAYDLKCPAAGQYISGLTVSDSLDYNLNFALKCRPGVDVGVTSIVRDSGVVRPANYANIRFLAGDLSAAYGLHCGNSAGSVRVIIQGPASYVQPMQGTLVPTVINDTLIYAVSNFSTIDFNNDFGIVLMTDTFAQATDQVCLDVKVTSFINDINTSNNSLTTCFPVVNSFDPNAKEVNPTMLESTQGWLTYTIYFQNTGNAPAQNIYLLDTLPALVDENTVQLLSWSFEPMVQVNGNVIRFNFPNINLADSMSNEPESHGYVQFKVQTVNGLVDGLQIQNRAYIYFDFNPPVITNDAITDVQCSPFSDSLQLELCDGDSLYFGGNYITLPGIYVDSSSAVLGCDSIVNLSLTFRQGSSSAYAILLCTGEIYNFFGTSIITGGSYTAITPASNGCDSVITLDVTMIPNYIGHAYDTICKDEVYPFGNLNLVSTGVYAHSFTGSNTCDSLVFLHLYVRQLNTSSYISLGTIHVFGGYTYQWLMCNNDSLISGANDTLFTPTQSGSYACILTNGICSDTTQCFNVVVTEMEEQENGTLLISPNPATHILGISSTSLIYAQLHIYNATGVLVYSGFINGNKEYAIDVSDFSSGVYILELLTDDKVTQKQFVKQ